MLLIKLKSANAYRIDKRVEASIKIYNLVKELFGKIDNERISVFNEFPLEGFNPEMEYELYSFGILNKIIEKFKSLNFADRASKGIIIEGSFKAKKNQNIAYSFILNPEKFCRKEGFDLRFEIFAREGLEEIDELFNESLKIKLHRIVKAYHDSLKRGDVFIKKALLSTGESYSDIRKMGFVYYSNPYEMLEDALKTLKLKTNSNYKVYEDRLFLTKIDTLSRLMYNNQKFIIKFDDFVKQASVSTLPGSLCLIPKNEDSMELFLKDLKEELIEPVVTSLRGREDVDEEITRALTYDD